MAQMHEYMLSKTPNVPENSPSQSSEEHPTEAKTEADAEAELEAEAEANQQDSVTVGAGNPGIPNPTLNERVVEEPPVAPANAYPYPVATRLVREIPGEGPSNQQVQRPEMRVQRSVVDDRLFTWAAVGLTIAILVLLFKKFIKSSGHGAVFMDGS